MTRVLYIEDEPNNRLLVKRLFSMLAPEITYLESDNAQTGIELAIAEPPHLILMDISMPDMDGLTATAQIRKLDAIRHVPIVALTANAMEGDRERFIAAGCDGYISKPIDIDTFVDTVRGFLKRAEPVQTVNASQNGGPRLMVEERKVVDPTEAHVLVVEDTVPNFMLIARMLNHMGIRRCEWKTSGWQVVQYAEMLPRVDLILLDIRLPYNDGYAVLDKVRQNPKLKNTVVCAVTAEASEEQMRRAQKAGFNGFLGKPLDPDRFPTQIRRLLNGEPVWEWQ